MEEKELRFDRNKHVCYSKEMKAVLLRSIRQHTSPEHAEQLWEKTQRQYEVFLKDLPYLGGKACTHNRAGGTYDCIAVFAYYEAAEEKPSLQELSDILNAVLLPPFQRLGKLVNVNRPFLLPLMGKIFTSVAKKDNALADRCPTGYLMQTEPYDKKTGVQYRFTRCPIAEFAKAHGYLDLMPAFCNGDYPAMAALHAGLIRGSTCANGDFCDYWIVGDKLPFLQQHPMQTDEKRYFYNPLHDTKK